MCRVLQFLPQLTKAVNFAAELDWYVCFYWAYKYYRWHLTDPTLVNMLFLILFISILSLAIVARQNNYVRPILTEDSILEIHNGRSVFIIVDLNHAWQLAIAFSFTYVYNLDLLQSHLDMLCRKWLLIPLFQMIPKFVMQVNSAWEIYKPSFLRHLELLQNFWHKIFYLGRINIVTGPNYSGKSIYIKQVIYFYNILSSVINTNDRKDQFALDTFQVALIVFLAHIGSFVPADSAIVGLTDRLV